MTRIQAIEQEILKLAQGDVKTYSGIQGKWGIEILRGWGVKFSETWGEDSEEDDELREASLPEDKSSERLAILKNILSVGYINGGGGYYLGQNHDPVIRLFIEWRDILTSELEQKATTLANQIQSLQTEVSTHLEALQRGQEWSQRQAQEIQQKDQTIQQLQTQLTQSQELNQKLQQDNKDLLRDIQRYKRTITALENLSQTKEQTIQEIQTHWRNLQTHWQNHLTQEKSQLTQEITLLKGVLT